MTDSMIVALNIGCILFIAMQLTLLLAIYIRCMTKKKDDQENTKQ